jgi:hypothetical protein
MVELEQESLFYQYVLMHSLPFCKSQSVILGGKIYNYQFQQ